jgi:DNA primase
VQKLFRESDRVIFCFDGDAAGRKAAWRALENALPVLADGKNAAFMFLPDGEDPDDFVRRRGKAAFEALAAQAIPASEFLLNELCAQHPPASVEGAAALVTAARPHIAALTAPVLTALLQRRLAELTGLPEPELRALLGVRPQGGVRRSSDTPPDSQREIVRPPMRPMQNGKRRAPSLVRELIQALLLQPELARSGGEGGALRAGLPQPKGGTLEEAALRELVAYCAGSESTLTTAGVMQHFAQSPHEPLLAAALASAEDHGITPELAAVHLSDGVARYRQRAHRAGHPAAPGDAAPTAEEAERLRQLEMVRRAAPDAPAKTTRSS